MLWVIMEVFTFNSFWLSMTIMALENLIHIGDQVSASYYGIRKLDTYWRTSFCITLRVRNLLWFWRYIDHHGGILLQFFWPFLKVYRSQELIVFIMYVYPMKIFSIWININILVRTPYACTMSLICFYFYDIIVFILSFMSYCNID